MTIPTSVTWDWNGSVYVLRYAYQDVSGWHIRTVDSGSYLGQFHSLALDGGDYPHISYYDETNNALKYAYQDASGWHIQIVDSAGRLGGPPRWPWTRTAIHASATGTMPPPT